VEDGGGDVAGQAGEFFVALELHAGLVFLRLVTRQCGLGRDVARQAQALGGDAAVFGGGQVAGRNGGCGFRCGGCDAHMASARGVEVAHTGGDGVKAVQRFAKGVQRQWLHVVFQIGPFTLWR
jgi:hypothetical protein